MRKVNVRIKPQLAVELAIRKVWARPEGMPRKVLVHGEPGLGKSTAVDRAAIEHGGFYLRAETVWSPRDLLEELASCLGLRFKRSDRNSHINRSIIGRLNELDRDEMPVIVIDEFDMLARKLAMTELVRGIYDATDIPFILVGMTEIERDLDTAPQFPQRIGERCRFSGIDFEDAQKIIAECCEVELTEDLQRSFWTRTDGNIRLLLTELAQAEETAWGKGLDSLGVEDLEAAR